ncbi:MAG: alpha-ketoglutarate-dependent taurine dioxygenase [Cellvibrionaceae bacterium]
MQGQAYTSTEYPPEQDITLHNELSYSTEPPRTIEFFCEIAPATGGQTPILDCRDFYNNMPNKLRDPFLEKGVLYVKNMHGGRG